MKGESSLKPLKLTITAFGPYKNSEVIDFDELQGNRLFVVSGNTGSGKTTIFDGICFALYGSASGEDRNDSKLLRSDFAEDDVHTSVELEFELRGRSYRILRQLAHVKQGNKGATGERYEFFERVNGKEVPAVDRQMVSEINKKVEELIGLTQAQFRQIVMLPQGEFRKLLTSQTEDKEEILRRIFKTEPYNLISELLKHRKRITEDAYKRELETLDSHIKNIRAVLPERENSSLYKVFSQEHHNINQITDGLKAEAAFYEEEVVRNNQSYIDAYKIHDKKQSEYHQAKALNARFIDLEDKKNKLTVKQEQIPMFKEKEKEHEAASQASRLEVYEIQVIERREEEETDKKSLETARIHFDLADKQLTHAKLTYQNEEGKKQEREEIQRQIGRLEDLLPAVKELDSKKEQLTIDEATVNRLFNELKSIMTNLGEEKKIKGQLNENIKAIDKEVLQLANKHQRVGELRIQCQVLKDYLSLLKSSSNLIKEVEDKKQVYKQLKENYTQQEKAWFDGQASIFAAHLHDGIPCPVCGSDKHPNKATGEQILPDKEALEALKNDLNEKENAYHKVSAELKAINSQLDTKEKEVIEHGLQLEGAQQSFNTLVEEGKMLKAEVDALTVKSTELIKLKESHETLEKGIDTLEKNKVEFESKYQSQKSAYDSAKAIFESKISTIPEQIRDLSELEKQIRDNKLRKSQLEAAWDLAQKTLQEEKGNQTKASASVNHIQKQVKETETKREKAELQFKEQLSKATFITEEAYHQAKKSDTQREALKQEIDQFNQALATIKQQVKELEEELKDKTRVDVTTLESQLEELKKRYEESLNALNQSKEYQQEACKLLDNIQKTNNRVIQLDKQYNLITDLYDVVRGQNSLKISFERYLQIEFLEHIIQAANERLKLLSNGQFYLMRSDRQESRGKQSGLSLDVYDSYTGQNRDVKTLSGGEKFNASLCLALGMADIIQSFQGGVSIDTMFIDEGFGSLDEESLNKAIDTLIDLQQSGRMIGVISHVQELKTAIPAILEVKKTKEGYSQTEFVIK